MSRSSCYEVVPAVQEEFTDPAEMIASGGKVFFLWNTSTRRGAHSSFCSLCPSLRINTSKKSTKIEKLDEEWEMETDNKIKRRRARKGIQFVELQVTKCKLIHITHLP